MELDTLLNVLLLIVKAPLTMPLYLYFVQVKPRKNVDKMAKPYSKTLLGKRKRFQTLKNKDHPNVYIIRQRRALQPYEWIS